MAPDTPEKRVGKANVENFKSCYSPAEKESGFTAYIPELIKMNKSFYPKRQVQRKSRRMDIKKKS